MDRTLRSQSELSTGKANVGQDGALWCVAWVVIPLAIAWTVSWLWLPVLTERNFLIALPASWLLYAWGLRRFVRSSAVRWVVVGALTLVVVIRLFGPGGHFRTVENAQFREATVAFVEQARQHPNALSIGFNPGLGEPDIRLQQFKYYLEREREPVSLDVLGGLPSELDELLRNVRERHAAHVVVLCAHGALSPAFDEAMRKDHDVLYNQRFVKASVWTYRRRDDAPLRQDY